MTKSQSTISRRTLEATSQASSYVAVSFKDDMGTIFRRLLDNLTSFFRIRLFL
jgi:hypothetical protein